MALQCRSTSAVIKTPQARPHQFLQHLYAGANASSRAGASAIGLYADLAWFLLLDVASYNLFRLPISVPGNMAT